MQNSSRGLKVSLRGASAKEASREALLEKVVQERASRLLAKKTTASALLIQRVWRGYRATSMAKDIVRSDFDANVCSKQDGGATLTAEEVSEQILRPLLFFIGQGSCFTDHSLKGDSDAVRLVTSFKLLLDSMNSQDALTNYSTLAIGSQTQKDRWVYQVHQVLKLCCAVVAMDGHKGATTNLQGLAMRVMVALTDSSMWKSFTGQENQAKGNMLVLNLLAWLAKGNGALFPAVRSYIMTNFPVPRSDNENEKPPERDKFIITASAVTMALRPLIVLSAALTEGPEEVERESWGTSSARAAVIFATHILTIPFLIDRLPAPLIPALQHPSALAPCLRSFGVSMKGLFKVTNSSSTLFHGGQDVEQLPLSLWALSNVISLASGCSKANSKGKDVGGQFVRGLIFEEYVQAVCCLLDDLVPWIDSKQFNKAKEVSKDTGDIQESSQFFISAMNSAITGEDDNNVAQNSVLHMVLKSLRPLHQQWHLQQLLDACKSPILVSDGLQKAKTVSVTSLTLSEVAKLYMNLLATFAAVNVHGGALPVLNLLAFSQSLLSELWEWLQFTLKLQSNAYRHLAHRKSWSRMASQSNKGLTLTKAGSSVRNSSGKWAAAIVLKMRTKNSGAEVTSSLEKMGSTREVDSEEEAPQIWDLESMKKGPAGVGVQALPVLSVFCAAYAHLLMVLDDDEFYDRQVPFSIDQQRTISAMLNTMVYNGFFSVSKGQHHSLMDAAVRSLRSLYERDCRRSFCPPELWLAPATSLHPHTAAAARAHHEVTSASVKMGDSFQAPGLGAVLTTIPHVLPFNDRVHIFREFVRADKLLKRMGGEVVGPGPGTIEIAVRRDHVVEDGFAQLNGLGSKLKSCINVSFVNELGLSEAGLDYGGLFKEFLTDLAKAAFDPGYGLFFQTATDEGLLYPHPAAGSLGHGLQMIEFLGQIIGKALYEGILLEYSFSPLFVSKLLGRYSFLDELSSLDAELHRNLMYLKHYEGDARDLALDFTVTEEFFGKHSIVELRPGGADIPVTNENKQQYVHAMADYKLNQQMKPVITAFMKGLADLIAPTWLGLFNAKEFNQLLSGGSHDFDVEDLRSHTRYTGGFTDSSRTVKLFWEVVEGLEPRERCALLKFVTSCSRAPLLGFKHLQPAFTIHKVVCDVPFWAIVGGPDVERLPSASTCYNTLKLPTYKRVSTLREKLRYAICSNAGFELS